MTGPSSTSAPVPVVEGLSVSVVAMARAIVDAGRVVPGLTVDGDGRVRSWWWPLPGADDRSALAAMVAEDTVGAHRAAADALAEAVDAEVRRRVVVAGVSTPRRPGRCTVAESWVLALLSSDPWLSRRTDLEGARRLAADVADWVRGGVVRAAGARLCLRLDEPAEAPDRTPGNGADQAASGGAAWTVSALAQAVDEPSLMRPAAELMDGSSLFADGSALEVLAALGRAVRVAPELHPLVDGAVPDTMALDGAAALALVTERGDLLRDAGIGILLPSWWTRRGRLRLRARARPSRRGAGSSDAGSGGGLGMDAVVDFTWEAALGDRAMSKRDLAALTRAAAAKSSVVKLRGEWVEVDPAELAALAAVVGTRGSTSARDMVRAGLGLDDLGAPEGLGLDDVVADGWIGDLLGDALHATVEPVADPPGFAGELRPYQQRGVGWLAFLGRLGLGACLADDMGLGKTAQLIAGILADAAPGPTVVVCPVSVLGNWQRELDRFAPSLSVAVHHGPDRFTIDERPLAQRFTEVDVVLTTYSVVARDVDQLAEVPWARLVLDEAQQVKNAATAQAKAVRRLPAGRRIALTGTPVENRLADLWSIMHVLNPGLLGSRREFRERFAIPVEREADPEATEQLRRITGPFLLRRLKTDRSIIDDLPDKIEQVEQCPLTTEQASLYKAVVDELLERAESSEGIERRGLVLAGISRLKQVCNHPAQFLHDGSALGRRSGKLNRTEELLDEIVAAGDKVLCFTQFAEWGELLVPHLAARYGTEPLWLHGGVPRRRRDAMVLRFGEADGPPVFLLSVKAGGTGLNLTAASHVIHLDRWWNPAVEDQATDRAFRIGQTRTVLVHKLVAAGTIEERIDEMITSKRALAERVVGTGEAWLTELSTDELRDLLVLRGDGDDD